MYNNDERNKPAECFGYTYKNGLQVAKQNLHKYDSFMNLDAQRSR